MVKEVVYTGKIIPGGSGIGSIASHQVLPLFRENMLKHMYVEDNKHRELEHLTQKINVSGPTYLIQDLMFDGFTSLVVEEGDIFHGWTSHSLFTMRELKDSIKIVNLYSAHITEQRKLLNNEMNSNMVDPILEEKIIRELDLADYIHVPSEFIYKSLAKYGLERKAKINPFGVDLKQFTLPDQSIEVDSKFRAIFVGTNWLRKGLHYLLGAWKKLNLTNAELIVAGIREPIAENVPNVTYGWYNHDELIKLYQKCNVFVLPALEDGCPLVTYEAMACGLPVIISENTGTYQHVYNGHNGFIVPIKNAAAIMDKLEYLYHNRDFGVEMGRRGRKIIEAFPWERHEKTYIEWIKSL